MIELKNITKIYNYQTSKELVALKDINLRVKSGEFVVLMGASGSGKSTILSLIAGLLKPTFGEVLVDGEVISKLPDSFATVFRRENIGFIFQKFNLFNDLSVFDNIVMPLVVSEKSAKEIEALADKVMREFNILHKKEQKVSKLSGGEQQRCAIARAMINDPKIILADEPTANLDDKLSREFIESLKRFKDEGKTIVVATHDRRFEGLDFIDRVVEVKCF